MPIADGDGIRFAGSTWQEWQDWSRFESVIDATRYIALVTRAGSSAQLIPGRAFADRAQQSAWIRQVRDWIAAAAAPAQP